MFETTIADGEAMERFGARLAECTSGALTLFLEGELGVGKTTLVRGFLRARGHAGPVRSPTYTLVEPYDTTAGIVYHFDLYRLGDPEELEYMGIRDYFAEEVVCLVEWPDRGAGLLPVPDLCVTIDYQPGGRSLVVKPFTSTGRAVTACLAGG